jgi:predicted helicase
MFQEVIDVYQQQQPVSYQLEYQVEHVDGSMNTTEKEQKISWLKGKPQ